MLLHIRFWVALVGFGLFATSGWAQDQAPVVPAAPAAVAASVSGGGALLRPTEVPGKYKTYLEQRYAADPGAQAIIKRFGRRQTGGALWLAAGAGAIATVASQTGTTTSGSGTTTVNVSPLGYGILVGVFGGVGVGKLVRFSNQRLFDALLAYDQQAGRGASRPQVADSK